MREKKTHIEHSIAKRKDNLHNGALKFIYFIYILILFNQNVNFIHLKG